MTASVQHRYYATIAMCFDPSVAPRGNRSPVPELVIEPAAFDAHDDDPIGAGLIGVVKGQLKVGFVFVGRVLFDFGTFGARPSKISLARRIQVANHHVDG